MYKLIGQSIGSCGCRIEINCACWDQSTACDSFVAYHIESGNVQSVSVNSLTIARWIQEANQTSILMIDDRATSEQITQLVQAFNGSLGGILADINLALPLCQSVNVFPIQYKPQQGFAQLWMGGSCIREKNRSKPFTYSS